MKDPRRIASVLFLSVIVLRPHLSGATYPFAQGLLIIPLLVGLGLMFLSRPEPVCRGKEDAVLMDLPWLACAWSLLSLAWTADPGQGARETASLALNVSAFTMVCLLGRDPKRLERGTIWILGLVVVPVLASAFYQRIFGLARIRQVLNDMVASGENVSGLVGAISHGRVFAGYLNPNMLAGFLAIVIPLTLDLGLASESRRSKALLYALTAGEGAALFLTGSLGGTLVAVLAGSAVFLTRRGLRRIELAWIGTATLILIGGLLLFRGIDTFLGSESSFVQRGGYMAAGVRMALSHPLAGWGSGSSPGALMTFVGEGVRPVADPHNFPIRIWMELGVPGLLLLGGFLTILARKAIGPVFNGGFQASPPGYNGYLFGSAAFLLHSLMDMDFFVPETALFGWCAMGALLAAALQRPGTGPVGEDRTGFWRVLGGLALAAVLPSLVFLQGESLAFRGLKAVQSGDFNGAAVLYRNAGGLLPFSGRFALEEGRARFTAGDPAGALDLFRKADRLMTASPYPPWEIGRAAQADADWETSLAPLERARSRYPTSPRILIDLARSHLNLGDVESARKALGEAERLSVFDPEAGNVARMILDRIKP